MGDLFRRNPLAVVLAVVMHLVILLFLAVGVDWWRTPKPIASNVEVVQARLIESKPVPPKPAAKPEPVKTGPSEAELEERRKLEQARKRTEAERRHKIAAQEANRRKAEKEKQRLAAVKKKQEVERRARAEAEKKRREQEQLAAKKAKAKKAKKEAARKKAELERQRKLEAEKQRKAEEARKRKALAKAKAEKARAAAEAKARVEAEARAAREAELTARLQAEEDVRERDRTIRAIQQKIERNWLRPPGTASRGLRCEVRVRLSGTGLVILARVVKSSGQSAFDRSVISAVEKAEPLPMPSSASLAAEFRDIVFEFDPSE